MAEVLCELGVFGLSALGQSLAAHHASSKIRTCVGDEDPTFVPQVIGEYRSQIEAGEHESDPLPKASRCMLPANDMCELVARVSAPRKIIVFGTHGDDRKFEELWNNLFPLLDAGDTVLRWGREEEEEDGGGRCETLFYDDAIVASRSRLHARPKGIHLIEMVRIERDRLAEAQEDFQEIFMVGGPKEGYNRIKPFISPFAYTGHVGEDAGCAHYANMVRRTIENGVGQSFAEAHAILTTCACLENPEIGLRFKKWSDEGGRMSSYLLDISQKICYKRDNIVKKGFVLDHILDSVDLNSVDTWAALEATKLGVPAPTVNATLDARFMSLMKDERVEASSVLKAPELLDTPSVMKDQISEDLQRALYCACVCLCAECFAIFLAASEIESWDLNLAECVRLWNQPGLFLESTLMKNILSALKNKTNGNWRNLLTVPNIASDLQGLHMSWRRIVALSFASAVACPTLSSSLTYYDSYRCRRLPTGLIRAQQDFFGASGYDRVEQEGRFTTNWTNLHTRERKRKAQEKERDANLAIIEAEETEAGGREELLKKRRRK